MDKPSLPPRRRRARLARLILATASFSLGGQLSPSMLEAQEMALPIEVQWSLYDRILAFDRGFSERADGGIVVGILFQSRYRESLNARNQLLDLAQRTPARLGGRSVRLVSIEATTPREIGAQLREEGVDVLYITPLRALDLSAIAEISSEQRVLTLTGVREYVHMGVGLGLGLRGGRPEILVNLRSCRAQGAELSAELLKLSTVLNQSL